MLRARSFFPREDSTLVELMEPVRTTRVLQGSSSWCSPLAAPTGPLFPSPHPFPFSSHITSTSYRVLPTLGSQD